MTGVTWLDATLAFMAGLGLKAGVLLSSAIGGFLSLRFFDGELQADGTVKPLTATQKWSIAGGGGAMGVYVTPIFIEAFEITDRTGRVEIGLGLVIALFGMSIAARVIETIRKMDLTGFIEGWLPKRK